MRFLELAYRVFIQDEFYRKLSDYYYKKSSKYVDDPSKNGRWTKLIGKSLYWDKKWLENQTKIDEIIDYYSEKLKGLI